MTFFPIDPLPLLQGEVHVWRWSLAKEGTYLANIASILSPEEQARANRFYFADHRRRFIVARATLKILLGRYLSLDPVAIAFVLGDRGKPFLPPTLNSVNLQFNLSHSHEMAVAAFVCDRSVGIDIEHLRWVKNADILARRFFCEEEYGAIAALAPEGQSRAFLKLWTAKEALLKGLGSGISGGLDQVEIRLNSDNLFDFHVFDSTLLAEQTWRLVPIEMGEDYLGALALEGHCLPVCDRWFA
jgi:4'-phosphopantetheinyl transferase